MFTSRAQQRKRQLGPDVQRGEEVDGDIAMAAEIVNPALADEKQIDALPAEEQEPADREALAAAADADAKAVIGDNEAKRNHALGQMARLLAKQKTRTLRQRYKREAQFPMYVSGAVPFIGLAEPLSTYLCLDLGEPKAAVEGKADAGDAKAEAVARSAERKGSSSDSDSGGSDCSGSEAESDSDSDNESDCKADLPDADEAKAETAARSEPHTDSKDGKDEKTDRPALPKPAAAPGLPKSAAGLDISIAFFTETSYVDELRAAGVSKRGRARMLTGTSATKLFSGT